MSEEEQLSDVEATPVSETEEESYSGFQIGGYNLRYRRKSGSGDELEALLDTSVASCREIDSELEFISDRLASFSPDQENWRSIQSDTDLELGQEHRQIKRESLVFQRINQFNNLISTMPETSTTNSITLANNTLSVPSQTTANTICTDSIISPLMSQEPGANMASLAGGAIPKRNTLDRIDEELKILIRNCDERTEAMIESIHEWANTGSYERGDYVMERGLIVQELKDWENEFIKLYNSTERER